MRLRTGPLTSKLESWLHLILVASILLYAYAPFLDHWLDRDVYARPHTHIHLSTAAAPLPFQQTLATEDHAGHDAHEETVFCALNIDALLSLLLFFFVVPPGPVAAPDMLAARLAPVCLDVSIVYLSTLDPPPTI